MHTNCFDWMLKTLRQAAWAPGSVFCFYVVAAKGFGAYILFPNLDILTHFIGGVAFSYFVLCAVMHAPVGEIPPLIIKLLAFTCTGTMVVFWEFYEFAYDRIFAAHTMLGVNDTLSDMFFGLLGALTLVMFYRFSREATSTQSIRRAL